VTTAPAQPRSVDDVFHELRLRGDRFVRWFILGHVAFALCLAPIYGTWTVTLLVAACGAIPFLVSAWLLPGQFVTRALGGVSLQLFCALHIFQLHGMPEMHFFFFTSTTVMIVYQDHRAMWPGVFLIIVQHSLFAFLQNAGVPVHFFPEQVVTLFKLAFHFGIALGQGAIASAWAFLLAQQTRQAARDAEVRREMDARLMLSERLASLGMLAAGVGHEVNNPLAVAMANLELLGDELSEIRGLLPPTPLGTQTVERLDSLALPIQDIKEAAARIRDIVRDLRKLSRSDDAVGPVDIAQVLEASCRASANQIRHRAHLVTELSGLPLVRGNEARFQQVFLNLLINAAHAIPEGHAERNVSEVTGRYDGQRVEISVRDSGKGMSPQVMAKVFDPFFTTKEVGEGTGLGLSLSHRIVTDAGGAITVESEPGEGTTFRVSLLPADPSAPQAAGVVANYATKAAPARVLVIDDEPGMGRAVGLMLPGHEITSLTSAREALRRLSAGERWDLILCDVMMPEVSGVEFFGELARKLPQLLDVVVFTTGGAFTAQAEEFLTNLGPGRWLEKPFESAVLHGILAERQRRARPAA
jgi:signal transduction histidine kinase